MVFVSASLRRLLKIPIFLLDLVAQMIFFFF